MGILRENEEGGIAYFKLESVKGRGVLEALSAGVELDKIREILWMYSVALTGIDVQIQTGEVYSVHKTIWWVSGDNPTPQVGPYICLPFCANMASRTRTLRLVARLRDSRRCTWYWASFQVRVLKKRVTPDISSSAT